MNKFSLITLSATAAFLAACGDSNSTGASSNTISSTTLGSLMVNKEAHTYTTITTTDIERCVLDTNKHKVSWKNITRAPDTSMHIYEFHGDTLVIFDADIVHKKIGESVTNEFEKSTYGEMYIGGTPGELYGTWDALPCEYNSESDYTTCSDSWWEASVTFSEKRITSNVTRSFKDYKKIKLTSDYTDSKLMEKLYSCLSGVECVIYPDEIMLKYDLSEKIKELKVDIQKKDASNETFAIDGKTYTLKINSVSYDIDERNVSLEIFSGQTTCTLEYNDQNMTEDRCQEKLIKQYMNGYEIEHSIDSAGHRYYYISNLTEENTNEFEKCLAKFAPSKSQRGALAKKANEKTDTETFEGRREKQYYRLLQYRK